MKMTIKEFCRKHSACWDGAKWAVENCHDMDEVWQNAKPEWLIWVATREGVLTDKELRLFAVWCARQVQHLMTDERSIAALDVAERYANGNATDKELNEARRAAWEAARDVADAAADAAPWATARDGAKLVAWDAHNASETAVWAAWDAREAARDAQVQYLRQNCKPNFNL